MQVVILAAGKGSRLKHLTTDTPKPLVHVGGRPLLEHTLDRLPKVVSEIIMVIGYLGDKMQAHFGDQYKHLPIKYVWQEEQTGPGSALKLCKDLITDDFLVMYSDDIVDAASLHALAETEAGILGFTHDKPHAFGVIEHDDEFNLVDIEEKPENPKTNVVSVGPFKFPQRAIDYPLVQHPRTGEYYVVDFARQHIPHGGVKVVIADEWLTVSSPEDAQSVGAILSGAVE